MVSAQFSFARVLPPTFISQYIIDHQSLDLADPWSALRASLVTQARYLVILLYCIEVRDIPRKIHLPAIYLFE